MFTELNTFISTAERNRKYAPNTASGHRVALALFEKELNEEERSSLDKFTANFDAIYTNVFRKNKENLSAATLEIYKRRIKRLIGDFEKYGVDPTKMASWNPKTSITKSVKAQPQKKNLKEAEVEIKPEFDKEAELSNLTRFELPLRADEKAIILTPKNLTTQEADAIIAYLTYLRSLAKE